MAATLEERDDLTGQSLAAELWRDRDLQRHGFTTLGCYRPPGDRSLGHDDVVRADGDDLAIDRELGGSGRPQLASQRSRISGCNRRRDALSPAAEPPSQRAEIGLHRVAHQLAARAIE